MPLKNLPEAMNNRFEQFGRGDARHQAKGQASKEFTSVEEMIRYDAEHTSIPDGLEEKVKEAARQLPGDKPWWKRLLGR